MRLTDPAALDVDEATSRSFIEAVRPLFESEGFGLHWLDAKRWLATHRPKIFTPHTIASPDRLWAEFQRIRAQGWALSEQQLDLNSRGVAVPQRDRHGALAGALSITMPIGREKGEDAVARTLPVLRETAQAMRDLI